MKELISDKDLKKIFAENKKQVKKYKGKENNSFMCSGNLTDIISVLYVMKELGGGDLYIRITDKLPKQDLYADIYSIFTNNSPYLMPLVTTESIYEYIKPFLKLQ